MAVVNNLDGTYTVTMSEPLTAFVPNFVDTSIVIYSPGDISWHTIVEIAPQAGAVFTCECFLFAADGTKFIIADAPLNWTCTNPVDLNQGFVPIM